MSEANGQSESRLDRIERMLERSIAANESAPQAFMQEHKLLLTAQVLMTDTMTRLELKSLETSEKLDALIRVVDGMIGRPRV